MLLVDGAGGSTDAQAGSGLSSGAVAAGRRSSGVVAVAVAVGRHLGRAPVSLALALATVAVSIVSGSAVHGPDPRVRRALALDVPDLYLHGRIGELLTSVLLPGSLPELLLVVAALVIVMGGCERRIGSLRAALVWLTAALAGGLIGTALQAAGLLARGLWATPPITVLVLHPETPLLGVLLAASAFAGPFWRRRIRVIGVASLVVLLLYSGQPEDLYHLAGAVTGLLLGVALARRVPAPVFPRSSHHEARTLLSALTAVAAIGPVVAVLQPTGYGLLRPLGRLLRDPMPFAERVRDRCPTALGVPDCEHAARLAQLNGAGVALLAVLPLLVLLVAAAAVLRGRRVGVWLGIGVNLLLAALAAGCAGVLRTGAVAEVEGAAAQTVLAVLVPLTVAGLLLLGRAHCPVLPERRTLVSAAVAVGAAGAASAAVYLGVGMLARHQFAPAAAPPRLVDELPGRFVPTGFLAARRLNLVPVGPVSSALDAWTGTAVWAVLLVAALVLARSAATTTSARERTRLLALLRTGAGGSIAWMATWPGNRTWFSADGRHAVAYRDAGGVALAVGEPVGPEPGAVEAARAFALHCDDRGLVPAFHAVRPEFAALLGGRDAAWSSLGVGEEAVIDPRAFSLAGRARRDVRSSCNRAARTGVSAEWTRWHDLSFGRRAQVESISEEWVAERPLPELGFTLGSLAELKDPEVRLMLAIGPDQRVEAVTSWLPTWRDGREVGLTLDVMRRRRAAQNGLTEFLIAEVVSIAQQQRLEFVSLSVAPLQGRDRGARLLSGAARLLEPAYGFRSLAAFKEKFAPDHRPRVLAFPDAVALPAISLAVARAYLPERPIGAVGQVLGALRPPAEAGRRHRPASEAAC